MNKTELKTLIKAIKKVSTCPDGIDWSINEKHNVWQILDSRKDMVVVLNGYIDSDEYKWAKIVPTGPSNVTDFKKLNWKTEKLKKSEGK